MRMGREMRHTGHNGSAPAAPGTRAPQEGTQGAWPIQAVR